jgi:hypothetical protein
MRLTGITAMLRKNTGHPAPGRIAPGRSTTGRGPAPGIPGRPGRVRPVSAAGTNGA